MSPKSKRIHFYLALTSLLCTVGCDVHRQPPPSNATKAPDVIAAMGRLVPGRAIVSVAAAAPPPGDRLLSLEVKVGQNVEPGDVLARLETYTLRGAQKEAASAAVISAQKSIPLLEADLDYVRTTFKRVSGLKNERVVSDQTFDDRAYEVRNRELALEHARADLRVAEAQYAVAAENVNLAVIRAPIRGQILKILTWPGEQIGVRPILEMGDTTCMVAVTEVHETDIRRVRIGQTATVSSPALAEPLQGTVEEIGCLVNRSEVLPMDPRADVDTRVVEVRVRLKDSAAVANLTNLKVHVRIDLTSGTSAP